MTSISANASILGFGSKISRKWLVYVAVAAARAKSKK
jgi:hypothetical protein